MKFHLRQSEEEATDWIYNDFKGARRKLVVIYMLIIFGVILLFSLLVIFQAQSVSEGSQTLAGNQIIITEKEARQKFFEILPSETINKTEYEFENGVLLFTVEYGDQQDFKVNLFTGKVLGPEKDLGLMVGLINDFDEKIIWIGLLVFLIASFGSIVVANITLSPITKSIRREKEFIAGAAHELRNPLASMQAVLEASLLEQDPQKEELLNDMLSETKHLTEISESLLSIEKTQHRKRDKKEVSVAQVAEDVFRRLSLSIEEKKIKIKKDITNNTLLIDKLDLDLIIHNLLHNAIKFSRTGGIIKISWRDKILSISDNGIGIDAGMIPFIFDRFYKNDVARNTAGSGLGLSIVKEILVQYKANIKVTSGVGEGTEFVVTF
jgi:signal transduction histidine kinase